MVGKDVGVRSFLCKPGSGEAREPLLFFFLPCTEQKGMDKGEDRADGRGRTALVNSYLQNVCRSGREDKMQQAKMLIHTHKKLMQDTVIQKVRRLDFAE